MTDRTRINDRELAVRHPQVSEALMATGRSINRGWSMIVRDMSCELLDIIDDDGLDAFRIGQVKQKFGELRVYAANGNDRTDECIREAIRLAAQTCEFCGGVTPDVKIRNIGYIATCCDQCGVMSHRRSSIA